MLFCRENVGVPAGIFPLAFSDRPPVCLGTVSSTEEETDEGLEWRSVGVECAGV